MVSEICLICCLVHFCLCDPYPDFSSQVWSSKDFKPVKTLSGHESKVTSLDVVGGQFSLKFQKQTICCHDILQTWLFIKLV